MNMMKFTRLAATLIAAVSVTTLALPAAAQQTDEDVIEYRQHIMKAMDAQTAAVGKILSFAIPEDQLPSHLETIAIMASTALDGYEKRVLGGESLPAIWDNWDDFSARMNDFATKIAATAEHAKEGGREAIMGEIVLALSCKSCHDLYREKK
jgi:cytochrome c556